MAAEQDPEVVVRASIVMKYAPVPLGDIVEIEETTSRNRANQLLAAGFQLLIIQGTSWEAERRPTPANGGGENAPTTFIRHNLCYVIGRANGWPIFPAREERPGRPSTD